MATTIAQEDFGFRLRLVILSVKVGLPFMSSVVNGYLLGREMPQFRPAY